MLSFLLRFFFLQKRLFDTSFVKCEPQDWMFYGIGLKILVVKIH